MSLIKNIHFTNCRKPWNCAGSKSGKGGIDERTADYDPIQSATVSEDGTTVRLKIDQLQIGHVHELKLSEIITQSGELLWNPVAYYTLNEIPKSVL